MSYIHTVTLTLEIYSDSEEVSHSMVKDKLNEILEDNDDLTRIISSVDTVRE